MMVYVLACIGLRADKLEAAQMAADPEPSAQGYPAVNDAGDLRYTTSRLSPIGC